MDEEDETLKMVKEADRKNHLIFKYLNIVLIVISIFCFYLFIAFDDWVFLLISIMLISLIIYFLVVLKTHKVFKQ